MSQSSTLATQQGHLPTPNRNSIQGYHYCPIEKYDNLISLENIVNIRMILLQI